MTWNPDQEWLDQLAQDRESLEYKLESVIYHITEEIVARMEELGVNRTELAERINVSKAMVSKLLNGYENVTLKTLVKIASGIDCEVSVTLPPCGFQTRYFYVPKAKTPLTKKPRSFENYAEQYTNTEIRIEPTDDIGEVA